MNNKILIVDDEITICDLLYTELTLEGYICECAYDGEEALEKFHTFKPNLVLLDIMLPKINGYDVCRQISATDTAIIMLSAKSEVDDKILGLDIGADDYITKPFDTKELFARIKALIRRYQKNDSIKEKNSEIYKNGDISMVIPSKSVYIGKEPVKLTVTEFELLLYFMENLNVVLSRKDLAAKIGINDFDTDTRAIDMHIQRLRRKLSKKSDDKLIETVFGLGYIMRNFDEAEIQ